MHILLLTDRRGETVLKKNSKSLILYIPFFFSILLLVFLNIFYHDNWLDSDMAAEMIFSRLLSRTGHFFATPDWYYSTEFRFLYTHWMMGPLFCFLKSWHAVRMITNLLTYTLMVVSYFFFMKPFQVRRELVFATASLLLLPFSETMMTHMVMGNTYLFHVIISFLFMGCFFRLTGGSCKRKWLVLAGYLILALICGVSGVRYLLALQCPLVLAYFLGILKTQQFQTLREEVASDNWKEKLFAVVKSRAAADLGYGLAGLAGALAGYLINLFYVSRQYVFQTYEATNFIAVYQGIFLERVQNAFGSLIMLFGYIPDKGFLSVRGLISMISFLLILLFGLAAVCSARRETGQRGMLAMFFWTALALNVFVFVFTTSTMVPRYYLTLYIFLLPLLCFYLEGEKRWFDRVVVGTLLGICILLASGKEVLSYISADKNAPRREVAEFLKESRWHFGYATYWNANILTELTNGAVEVANIVDARHLEFFKWSSPMYYYREEHTDEVFLLLTAQEYREAGDAPCILGGKKVYEDENYIVLIYDSEQALLRLAE